MKVSSPPAENCADSDAAVESEKAPVRLSVLEPVDHARERLRDGRVGNGLDEQEAAPVSSDIPGPLLGRAMARQSAR
jgi:hypothetical protein